jgi:hypothetical protein
VVANAQRRGRRRGGEKRERRADPGYAILINVLHFKLVDQY